MRMSFFTVRSDEERFRLLIVISLLISLAFHLGIFTLLKKIPLLSPGVLITTPPAESVRLEFIDSPERILPPEEEPRDTNLISDRASRAQDVIPDKTEATDRPRSVGAVEEKSIRKVPAGRPGGLEEPGREAPFPPAENLGVSMGEIARKEELERREESARAEGESPFQLQGRDRYLSPEAEDPDGKTNILKQVAYNAFSPAVGKYLARLKPRVKNRWDLTIMKNTFYVHSENTTVFFKIRPDGSLENIKAEHAGPEMEMYYALNAIEKAQPFEPLTEEILEYIKDDGLWLEINFIYH